jgi:hypothetical protein
VRRCYPSGSRFRPSPVRLFPRVLTSPTRSHDAVLAGTSTYVWSWRIGGRIGQAESRPQFLSWTRWLVRPASRRPAGGTWRPLSRCDAPPRMTVSTSRRIEESPRHWTTAVPLPRAPHRPPPELRSASILAASKFTLGARGVRIAGQHAIGRVQPAAGQGRAVFTGHLPRPRPSTPVLSTGPWVLRSNLYPEDGRQSIGLSCR